MSKTISYDPNWRETYSSQILSAPEAVKRIRPGQRVFIGTGTAEPLELVSALSKRAYELPDTEIVHLLTFGDAPYAHREMAQYFRVNSFFIAENVRDIIQEGLGDYTPVFLSDIPRLFDSGQLPLDVALIHVTPPDEYGMCSFGVSVDIVKKAAENAETIRPQVAGPDREADRLDGHHPQRRRKRVPRDRAGECEHAPHARRLLHPHARH